MAKPNQTQKLLADVAALEADGWKFGANVRATASRNYGYYYVEVRAARGAEQLTAKYQGSTVNSRHEKGGRFEKRLAAAVEHDAIEQLVARNYRANSNLGRAMTELIDSVAEVELATA